MKNKNLIVKITTMACFMAIIAITTFVPYLGFIPLGFTSVTIIHLFVIVGALLFGKRSGAILGLIMGICSLIKSTSGTPNDIPFIYPWVSIIPRVLFGYLTGVLYEFITIKKEYLKLVIVSVTSTIIHTLLVFIVYLPTYLYIIADQSILDNNPSGLPFALYCLFSFLTSCLFESILAGIVVPPCVNAVARNKKTKKIIEKVGE